MEKPIPVVCAENEELAELMWKKRQEMADRPKGGSENINFTLYKAYSNVCNSKTPIKTLKDFSKIKGVGKWILRLMQGFFRADSSDPAHEDLAQIGEKTNSPRHYSDAPAQEVLSQMGKKPKRPRRYLPQKNSVAYALLITLYRGTINGSEFMRKQELIDAAEASGLSRVSIGPEKGKGKPVHFGSSPKEWYTGWSNMGTLITKGLVVKSSNPAKYMLTQEGLEAAHECLSRSGLVNVTENTKTRDGIPKLDVSNTPDLEFAGAGSAGKMPSGGSTGQKKSIDMLPESFDRFVPMGFSKEQIRRAVSEVSETSQSKDVSSLWPAILCRLREDQVYGSPVLESQKTVREGYLASSTIGRSAAGQKASVISGNAQREPAHCDASRSSLIVDSAQSSFTLRACSSSDYPVHKRGSDDLETCINVLSMPPLGFGERFEDAYEVILVLDDREQFAQQGSRSRKSIENICTQFKIQIEVRRLPVGDGIWLARHKYQGSEYVLDFIVERKSVDDLRCSITDNRYKDQKLRLLTCGLKKLIYLVEGDPNTSEAAERIKTACFTTEILEGFDVQRTSGLTDTLKKYGYLTQSITQFYRSQLPEKKQKSSGVCPPFHEFMKRCQDLDKMTVSDVFAIQLMQVPQVTEKVALAVLDLYPTLVSLARAYSLHEGDISAQEEMLNQQSNNVVSRIASKNIYKEIWGS